MNYAQNIRRSLEDAAVSLQVAAEKLDFVEKNERFTEKEVMEIEERLTLINALLARCDRATGESKKIKSREKITTV